MQIKKNYSDSLAIFFYMMNCSLVHLALLVACQFMEVPDVKKAKELDAEFVA